MRITKLFFIALLTLLWTISCKESRPPFEAPVLKNIGNYNVTVTTKSKYSQMFFNQGIIMANGFNQGEAERSFKESIKQDSTFAMGYWGIAYVLGPNLNSAGDNMGTANEIQRAVAQAIAFGKNSSSWEKAIIKSIQIRFPKDSSTANAEAYLESMKEAVGHNNSLIEKHLRML